MNTQVTGFVFSDTAVKNKCKTLWERGERQAVFSLLIDVANKIKEPKKPHWVYSNLMFYQFNVGDYESALGVGINGLKFYPDDPRLLEYKALLHYRLTQYEEAAATIEKLDKLQLLNVNICDCACMICKRLEQIEKAKYYGLKSLRLKDEIVCSNPAIKGVRKKSAKAQLTKRKGAKNYISFSIFGDKIKYLRGLFDNYVAIQKHFPDWHMVVFADDSVPNDVLDEMKKLDIKLIMENQGQSMRDKLVWRFKPLEWESCGRVLVRDVDSTVSELESEAVEQWIKSDQLFHIMRDWYSHTELVLAGLWGGVAGILPKLDTLKAEYTNSEFSFTHYDQHLLRQVVWPRIKNKACIHDRFFEFHANVEPVKHEAWQKTRHFGVCEFVIEREAQEKRIAQFKHVKSLKMS